MKINWLKTIGTTAAIGFIGIPVAITTVSCSNGSNQEPNNGKLPDQVLTTDTSKITSFAEAMKFTNEYLTKNYNFEMFKKDLEDYGRELSKCYENKTNFIFKNITSNNDKTINFVLEQISTADNGKYKYVFECKNFIVTPILIKINQNQLGLGLYVPLPTQPESVTGGILNPNGNEIIGSKNNMIGYENNVLYGDFGWTQTQNPTIDNKKIYTNKYFIPKTINLTFNNIQDIESNLYK